MAKKQEQFDRNNSWKPATSLVHGGTIRSEFGEMSEAMFLTSGYAYDTSEQAEARFKGDLEGFVYTRYSNPTVHMFEQRMCALEGAEAARGTASGMAAVTAAMLSHLKAGDHVVAGRVLFGSCLYIVENLLPKFGVESTLVDGRDLNAWEAAFRPNTKAVFFETPTNPTLELVDIEAVCKLARDRGALSFIDNVFATPMLQRPMALGADVVVYSATKHIDGQGRCLGGIVLGSSDYIEDTLHDFYKHTGPSMSPFNAWVMLKGLETLPVRVERSCASAARIADFLADHPKANRVFYPGRTDHPQHDLAKKQMSAGGPLVTFEIEGGKDAAFKFMNELEIFKITNNLGDAKSLVTHPATTTHQRLGEEGRAEIGITDGSLRLSIGLEDLGDLLEDIDRALSA
ncbi:MAG: O-succinylhomoserine sulfhydrylase [Hyphomicrobiaceae bacterium]|nr:O-succinylhomoserine sulfhydrylase [Hyphomicrobiaceae bacterium]